MQIANMARLYRRPPSELLKIADPYTAWCMDEAIAYLLLRLENGDKLRPKKTGDNRQLLEAMGIPIQELKQ